MKLYSGELRRAARSQVGLTSVASYVALLQVIPRWPGTPAPGSVSRLPQYCECSHSKLLDTGFPGRYRLIGADKQRCNRSHVGEVHHEIE